jgi:uncharacterized membrane protein YbhN (UPF0104 family)
MRVDKKRFVAGLVVSLLCGYLAVRGINLGEAFASLSRVHLLSLLPATGVLLLSYLIRAYRWQLLLQPVKAISTSHLFASTMIGFMANNLLPLRAGEFVRAYAIARVADVSASAAFATLVIERVFDGIALSSFLLFSLFTLSLPSWVIRVNYVFVGGYIAVLVVCGMLLSPGVGGKRWQPAWLPLRARRPLDNFIVGLDVLRSGSRLLWVLVTSLVLWLVAAAYYVLLFQIFGLALSLQAAVILLGIVALGVALPAAPGFVGNYQYATVIALSLFAVPQEEALGFSLLSHVAQFIPITGIGLLYLLRYNLSLSGLGSPPQ